MAVEAVPSTNRVIMAYFTKAGALSTVTGNPAYTLYNSAGSSVASGTLSASGSYYPYTFNQASGVFQLVVTTSDTAADYPTWIEDIEVVAAVSSITAAQVADAVLDELIAEHVVSGSLSDYVADIKAKTDPLGTGRGLVRSPVSSVKAIEITQGDDYLNADGRAIELVYTGASSFVGGSARLRIEDPTGDYLGMWTATNLTADTLRFEPTKAGGTGNTATGSIPSGVQRFEVRVILANTHEVTVTDISDGRLTVVRNAATA